MKNPGFFDKYLKLAALNPFRNADEEKRIEKEEIEERKRQFGNFYLFNISSITFIWLNIFLNIEA